MANPEHVDLLLGNPEAIHEFYLENQRAGKRFIGLDLRGLSLHGVNLRGLDLAQADFTDARLEDVSFSEIRAGNAKFDNAYFQGLLRGSYERASFRGAVIRGDAVGGEFIGTDFTDADLQGTALSWCNFRRAVFDRANLDNAVLQQSDCPLASFRDARVHRIQLLDTVLTGVDLTGAVGLESVRFMSGAAIDYDTIARSGELPLTFLQGCGLPDEVIAFYESSVGAIRFYSAFISYSTAQQDLAERLYADLQQAGIRCWLATEDLKIGSKFRQGIDDAIRYHEKLLLILSQDSIASPWVEEEVEAAMERERREDRLVLFPVTVDDAIFETDEAWAASIRRQRHIGDFRRWKEHDAYQKSLERLLRDLRREDRPPEG